MSEKTQDREAFEAWARKRDGHPFAGEYLNLMWAAWRGGIASVSHLSDAQKKEGDVESAIAGLVDALSASKGWMRGYADSIIRDALDRNPTPPAAAEAPAVMTNEEIIRAAAFALGNPLIAEDLLQGHTMHTEHDDIVAIWNAARLSATPTDSAVNAAAVPSDAMFEAGWIACIQEGELSIDDDVATISTPIVGSPIYRERLKQAQSELAPKADSTEPRAIGFITPRGLQSLRDGSDDSATISADCCEGQDVPVYATPSPASAQVGEVRGFNREDLEAVADSLENGYEKTVNVGNTTGEGDEHLESTTAYAARFIRSVLSVKSTGDCLECGGSGRWTVNGISEQCDQCDGSSRTAQPQADAGVSDAEIHDGSVAFSDDPDRRQSFVKGAEWVLKAIGIISAPKEGE